jgi:hypothetical protein
MEEALRSHMLEMTALQALVGTRINWEARTQGAPSPDVVLHLIDEFPDTLMASAGAWSEARVQVDCWARTHSVARQVANTISAKAALGGLHCLRADIHGVRFRIFVIDRSSDKDTDDVGVIHRTRLDLTVWWAPLPEA